MKHLLTVSLLTVTSVIGLAPHAGAMTPQEYQQSLDERASPNYRPPAPQAYTPPPRSRPGMQGRSAEELYLDRAMEGDKNSIYQLGYINEFGIGKPKDVSAAIGWYARGAALHDEPSAKRLSALGEKFENGDDNMNVDYVKAHQLYSEALQGGYDAAAGLIKNLDAKAFKETPDDIGAPEKPAGRRKVTDIPF